VCTSHRVVPAEQDGTFNAMGLLIGWLKLHWGQESGARIILRFSGKVLLNGTSAFVSRLGPALECFSARKVSGPGLWRTAPLRAGDAGPCPVLVAMQSESNFRVILLRFLLYPIGEEKTNMNIFRGFPGRFCRATMRYLDSSAHGKVPVLRAGGETYLWMPASSGGAD